MPSSYSFTYLPTYKNILAYVLLGFSTTSINQLISIQQVSIDYAYLWFAQTIPTGLNSGFWMPNGGKYLQ